jgi:hypothetical protein
MNKYLKRVKSSKSQIYLVLILCWINNILKEEVYLRFRKDGIVKLTKNWIIQIL